MKGAALFIVAACCALSALSLAEAKRNSKPSVTVSPAEEFSTSTTSATTTTTPPTTTGKTNTTTPPTTTGKTNTTTPPTTTGKTNTTTPPTTTAKTNTTTPPTTTAKTNTTTPPTTTAKTNTTTPPTTTAKTNTTTPPTTTAKTNTTTPPTTTTTTSPPHPTPTPTNLTVGNYSLKTDKNVVCVMTQLSLQIRLATPEVNGTFIVQPKYTHPEGVCDETKANLTLVFSEGSITFLFRKNTTDNIVYVDTLSFFLSYAFMVGDFKNYTASNKSVHLFTAKVGSYYSCRNESLYMGKGLYLDVTQNKMQAFNLTNNNFGFPDPCPADKHDYRVAIAVGVTLLVLIFIVLLAYLLGRKRRTDGYQSL
ncbi:macrosialin-like [Mastacembelus armatus]|uniref:Macrosialin-like n=1 Tax=Mastacembelus armatus TaxID=205130 RepID=A0A3Q3KMQ3_9TELE|nr:macrosialin-like [Mastacembelus armatus]